MIQIGTWNIGIGFAWVRKHTGQAESRRDLECPAGDDEIESIPSHIKIDIGKLESCQYCPCTIILT
jgi:hypothetical protein